MSQAALERQNPELASAVKKLDRMNAASDPQRAQRALNQLTPDERRAYMAAVEEQGAMPEPANRAMRRQMAKQKKAPLERRADRAAGNRHGSGTDTCALRR